MAPPKPRPKVSVPTNQKKRKDPPNNSSGNHHPPGSHNGNKRPKTTPHHHHHQRDKIRDARALAAQPARGAFRNGELDVDKFVKAREYEIRSLEEGMRRSGKALNQRAFQLVPKELRRRTASHNVKKVPRRLRERGRREMLEDNTPTVTARRRKKTGQARLRLETVKRLRALGSRRKAEKERGKREGGEGEVTVVDRNATKTSAATTSATTTTAAPASAAPPPMRTTIKTRTPRIKPSVPAQPPLPPAKYRKRQQHKTWLPTHLFHAKRARLTPPSAPLWRFAIPLTPTAKSYRPTHRAAGERGAVAWDMSYMSTVGLEGREDSMLGVLRGLGVAADLLEGEGKKGRKWREGVRSLEVFAREREEPGRMIAPVTVVWSASPSSAPACSEGTSTEESKRRRRLFLRVHPSAFFQLWNEVVRLSKIVKPEVRVEDLRFEIGSVEITGPGATEALLGALWPSPPPQQQQQQPPTTPADKPTDASTEASAMHVDPPQPQSTQPPTHPLQHDAESPAQIWPHLAGLTNPSLLPANALLAFNVQDPRLHHPPRTISLPQPTSDAQTALLELCADWPVDRTQPAPDLFDRGKRLAAQRAMGSQKAVNRRKGAAAGPGEYPRPRPGDPEIPVLLLANTTAPRAQSKQGKQGKHAHGARAGTGAGAGAGGSWTVLLPWRCVNAVWYALMYYPLSTGTQPRFGGLDELRQVYFESGRAWFPGDFSGTEAGWEWEVKERGRRGEEWGRRPRGKRVSWEKVRVGTGRVGEVGVGWGCDWGVLVGERNGEAEEVVGGAEVGDGAGKETKEGPEREDGETQDARERGEKVKKNGKHNPNLLLPPPPKKPSSLTHLPPSLSRALLHPSASPSTPPTPTPPNLNLSTALATITLTLLTRGTPTPCARIYRLPAHNPELRKRWLGLDPRNGGGSNNSSSISRLPNGHRTNKKPQQKAAAASLPGLPPLLPPEKSEGKDVGSGSGGTVLPPRLRQQQDLARSLLLLEGPASASASSSWPECPGLEDLIGFVTAGNYNLGEGRGTGVGSVVVGRVVAEQDGSREGKAGAERGLCVVRDSGSEVGRLGVWAVVGGGEGKGW